MVANRMRRRTRSESGLSGGACGGGVWEVHLCRGIPVCRVVFAIGLHINRRPVTVVDLACASQILILSKISFFSPLSASPHFIRAASRNLKSSSRGWRSSLRVIAFLPIWSVIHRVRSRIGRIGCP